MAIIEWDGHLTEGDMNAMRASTVYYLHNNARISCRADNPWRLTLERIGAVPVTQDEDDRADRIAGGES